MKRNNDRTGALVIPKNYSNYTFWVAKNALLNTEIDYKWDKNGFVE
jgi:hypothetical protein